MITRFAPSPTGPLHLGHAFSAMTAYDLAQAARGTFLLRIEDIDGTRARPEWEEAIYEDLEWLGLDWPRPVMRQSERSPDYHRALDMLWSAGLLYPCSCNRRDILDAASAPQDGALPAGPDGVIYPGTCRSRSPRKGARPQSDALRLDLELALEMTGALDFTETGPERPGRHTLAPSAALEAIGDIVVARRDMGTSYHLSVVVDDAAQEITHVVRGLDLFDATMIHVALQRLLGLATPDYHHHRLIRDDTGKRLAKRDDARALRTYRENGLAPEDIRAMVDLQASGAMSSTVTPPRTAR